MTTRLLLGEGIAVRTMLFRCVNHASSPIKSGESSVILVHHAHSSKSSICYYVIPVERCSVARWRIAAARTACTQSGSTPCSISENEQSFQSVDDNVFTSARRGLRRDPEPSWLCSRTFGSSSTDERSTAAALRAWWPRGASLWPCSGRSGPCTEQSLPPACRDVLCALR